MDVLVNPCTKRYAIESSAQGSFYGARKFLYDDRKQKYGLSKYHEAIFIIT